MSMSTASWPAPTCVRAGHEKQLRTTARLVPRILLEFRVGTPHDIRDWHQDPEFLRKARRGLPLPRPVVLPHAYQILSPLAFVRKLEQTLVQDRVPDLLLGEGGHQGLRWVEYACANRVDER